MNDVLRLFRGATRREICNNYHCNECQKIYNIKTCPASDTITSMEISDFIMRVRKKLEIISKERSFEISEDEFIEVLEDVANGM